MPTTARAVLSTLYLAGLVLGVLYERRGVRTYWIVDPDGDVLDVWSFGEGVEEPRHERLTDRLPARVGAEAVGEIDLDRLLRRDA